MPPQKLKISRMKLEELYVEKGLSQEQIAARLHVSRKTVARRLVEEGIDRRAQTKRPTPARQELHTLYAVQRLTMEQIAEKFDASVSWVQEALKKHRIPSRARGVDRRHRRELPVDEVIRLYVEEGWSAAEVGRHLGVSVPLVLRTVHERGQPVRRPGPVRPDDGESDVELVNALYADGLVSQLLRKHSIPKRPPGRPILERFPQPVELGAQALKDLYLRAGLSGDHIELLTGHPRLRIRRRLCDLGVSLRDAGDPAPALRRIWQLDERH